MPEQTTLGQVLKTARLGRRPLLSLREAAGELGISPGYLSRLERDELPGPPSAAVLRRAAQFFGIPLDRLSDAAGERKAELIGGQLESAALYQIFRLAANQSEDSQRRMLKAAIDTLDLDEPAKAKLLEELEVQLRRTRTLDLPRLATGDDGLFAFDVEPRHLSRAQIERMAMVLLHKHAGDIGWTGGRVPIDQLAEVCEGNDIEFVVDDSICRARLSDGSHAVLGRSRWTADGSHRQLCVNRELYEDETLSARRRCRFTIGHELFHCVEHLPLYEREFGRPTAKSTKTVRSVNRRVDRDGSRGAGRLHTWEDWREWQANAFAAAILMPATSVLEKFEERFGSRQGMLDGDESVEDAAQRYSRSCHSDVTLYRVPLYVEFDVNPQAMALRLKTLGIICGD